MGTKIIEASKYGCLFFFSCPCGLTKELSSSFTWHFSELLSHPPQVEELRRRGFRLVMCTGDAPGTARAAPWWDILQLRPGWPGWWFKLFFVCCLSPLHDINHQSISIPMCFFLFFPSRCFKQNGSRCVILDWDWIICKKHTDCVLELSAAIKTSKGRSFGSTRRSSNNSTRYSNSMSSNSCSTSKSRNRRNNRKPINRQVASTVGISEVRAGCLPDAWRMDQLPSQFGRWTNSHRILLSQRPPPQKVVYWYPQNPQTVISNLIESCCLMWCSLSFALCSMNCLLQHLLQQGTKEKGLP